MADAEDPVDPKPEVEENCKPKCVKQLLQYQAIRAKVLPLHEGSTIPVICDEACAKRIDADDAGHKHCTGQYFDYWGCIDKCAASKVFNKLK